MDAHFRIDDAAARRMLKKAASRSADLRPVWGEVNAQVVQPTLQEQFRTAGATGGSPWRPLAPRTAQQRVRRGGNRGGVARPLWDTGRLRASWIKRGPESVFVSEKLRMERGTLVPYAAAHQQGSGRIPARPMLTERIADRVGNEAATRIARFIGED